MKTIESITINTIIIKKSQFITTLVPCNNPDDIENIIIKYSKKDATHNCYAYIVGNSIKASDDGEPSKTAGMPMLNVLQKQELSNIIAITTRYFGGIKLGAGGLVRAYSQSVSEALDKASIIEVEPVDLYKVILDYHYIKKFDHLLKVHNIPCKNIEYDEQVSYYCYIRDVSFFDIIKDLTNNNFVNKKIGMNYIKKD